MDCSLSGSSVHGIFQARILEWLPLPTGGDLPDPGIEPVSLAIPAFAGRFFITSTTWEAPFCLLVVRSLSCVQLLQTPWTTARQATPSFTIPWNLLKLMSIESVMPSNHLILYQPLLLLPSIFTSIRVFSNESVLHIRRPKYWSFSFSISPSNENSGLISFRIDWFDLLAVQGTILCLYTLLNPFI